MLAQHWVHLGTMLFFSAKLCEECSVGSTEDDHMSSFNSLGTHQVVTAGYRALYLCHPQCPVLSMDQIPVAQLSSVMAISFLNLMTRPKKKKKDQLICSVLSAAHFHACILRNVMDAFLFLVHHFWSSSCHVTEDKLIELIDNWLKYGALF